MSDLSFSKKTIYTMFTELGTSFLIPDYQRPYSWGRDECETLWEDLKNFAFPVDKEFNHNKDEYFLGTIVTFKNDCEQNEVIDGQQRLITLLLLLRAFYVVLPNDKVKKDIAECIWYTDEDGKPDETRLKVESEVATDEHIAELKKIIKEGQTDKTEKSIYAKNFRYFQQKVEKLKNENPTNFSKLPQRIMKNCIILPIETNTQSTAFRIFTTLNDRGMPLSDSDIFKSQFYKFFRNQGKQAKDNFIQRWKRIETICNELFHPRRGIPTDDLFMKYMYFLLANSETKSDTFKGLRIYYEQKDYEILKNAKVFDDLEILANFWNDIAKRDNKRFYPRILKRLYVLSYAPYSMWENILSLYFMGNRDENNLLDDEKFYKFLNKITAFFLMQAIVQPGVQAIRRPFFLEFQNILYGKELSFKDYVQNEKNFSTQFSNTKFSNTKPITRAILAWWTFKNENQELPPLDAKLEIEHIFAKKRAEFNPRENEEHIELLGNKTLLEKRINIRAADYRFADKKKYYLGQTGKKNEMSTFNSELLDLANNQYDFTEEDIIRRNKKIFEAFKNYLGENNLLK